LVWLTLCLVATARGAAPEEIDLREPVQRVAFSELLQAMRAEQGYEEERRARWPALPCLLGEA